MPPALPSDDSSPVLSRRLLLTSTLSTAAALMGAALAGTAQAQVLSQPGCSTVIPHKSTKEAARHTAFSNSYRRCGNCRFFMAPDRCIVVEGPTSPESTCTLWAQRGGQIGCTPDEPVKL